LFELILFKTLKWKNFLSTGNAFTEIDFQSFKTTLIVGHNGAGKSTLLDALSFALFGKPHRNINKPQLVNSINNKDCSVEVVFEAAGSEFRIVRGIKPAVFAIYKNGEMLNQESHATQYQKILEQNILKLNHKSFHQIVVLGSSSFVPFMQLPAQHRRDVIEDLLDIGVFSKMNSLIKEKNSILKGVIREIDYKIDIQKNKIDVQKKYISDVNRINKDLKDQKQTNIIEMRKDITGILKDNDELLDLVEAGASIPTTINSTQSTKSKLLGYQSQFTKDVRTVVKDAKFFEDNSTCPTCSQDIEEHVKAEKLNDAKAKAKELSKALTDIEVKLTSTQKELEAAEHKMQEIRNFQTQMNANQSAMSRIELQIKVLSDEIDNLTDTSSDINVAKDDLESYVMEKNALTETRLESNEQFQYNIAITEMLKDTGIKTKIVKQYIPVINKLVNNYLQTLEFFVHFELDESFSETIKSRHRDSFSYASFSEGEKQRIDLALLFTWRQVAKMKNSVSTNLLILDETFDSSLDYEGVDNLMKIIETLTADTNVFVISHKGDMLESKFEKKLEFFKDKNFSNIK
jgi:DNA repair exonuclease SbcCD ATPase subunit|tara:strand:+ start:6922 stop:8643 length:1722 start_codon:yes stop_codon:yes gene_type:complete